MKNSPDGKSKLWSSAQFDVLIKYIAMIQLDGIGKEIIDKESTNTRASDSNVVFGMLMKKQIDRREYQNASKIQVHFLLHRYSDGDLAYRIVFRT